MPDTFPNAVPVIRKQGITLREMNESDVPAWFERASDPESSRLSGDPIPDSVDVCFNWLETHRQLFRDKKGIRWAIVLDRLGASVGSIGLSNLSMDKGCAELGAVIGRAYWNNGIATVVGGLVTHYCFNHLGLNKIQADVLSTNIASRRVLEKLGFSYITKIPDYRDDADETCEGFLYELHPPDN